MLRRCGFLRWDLGITMTGIEVLRPAQRRAWLTLIEFAGIIVVTVTLTPAVLKRAARR
jgi:hypothetical protein